MEPIGFGVPASVVPKLKTEVGGILEKVYPVESVYMSVNNTNPGKLFGGTWEC